MACSGGWTSRRSTIPSCARRSPTRSIGTSCGGSTGSGPDGSPRRQSAMAGRTTRTFRATRPMWTRANNCWQRPAIQADFALRSSSTACRIRSARVSCSSPNSPRSAWTLTNWTLRPDPHGLLFILFHSKGFANTTGYKNEQVDALLEQAMSSYDQKQRQQLYFQAQQLIVQDAPYVFFWHPSAWYAMSQKVQNFKYIPDDVMRVRDLWLSP